MAERGRELFGINQCVSCHLFEGRLPEGELGVRIGPELNVLPVRRRMQGVEAWLRAPQQMMPGTLMPAYFHSFDPDTGEIAPLRETSDREVADIVSFLFHGSQALWR